MNHNALAMPKKEIRHPDKEKSIDAYSAAVEIDGWVYLSGLGPVDPKTGQPDLYPSPFSDRTLSPGLQIQPSNAIVPP